MAVSHRGSHYLGDNEGLLRSLQRTLCSWKKKWHIQTGEERLLTVWLTLERPLQSQ